MSWSPDLYIGELRPWPDSVHVVRGKTDEARRYTPERKDGQEALERRIDELCAEVERGKAEFKKMDVWHSQELKAAMDENAKLRDENTELRKLGGFMLRCISQYHDCADCLVNGEHCEISYIESDARELGIEVPS